MSALIQLGYRAQRQLWKLLRPRTRGVKLMAFNGRGQILLIRNSYGATKLFVLPGGGVRPWEQPATALRREMWEELRCTLEAVRLISAHVSSVGREARHRLPF